MDRKKRVERESRRKKHRSRTKSEARTNGRALSSSAGPHERQRFAPLDREVELVQDGLLGTRGLREPNVAGPPLYLVRCGFPSQVVEPREISGAPPEGRQVGLAGVSGRCFRVRPSSGEILLLHQLSIVSGVAVHEFVVRSHFDDFPSGDDDDDVGISDGGESMCDDDGGAFFCGEEVIEGLLYHELGFGV